MLDLFDGEMPVLGNRHKYGEFDYLHRTLKIELLNVDDYYKNRVYAVKNTHLLVRLLTHLSVPISYSADRYVNTALARTRYVATSFGITSDVNQGIIHDGVFYGPGSKEIIIHNEEYFNPFAVETDWKNICAVQVLTHPKSDLNLLLPNGKYTSTGSGLSAFSVNLALLALQYRGFCLDQSIKMDEKHSLLGLTHFIHMYVLPNMVFGQLDLVLLNRLMNIYYKRPQGTGLIKHPFNILQYPGKIDNHLNNVLYTVSNKPMLYKDMLNNIPCVTSNSMIDALELPDVAPTRQVLWSLLVSRLDVIKFLIDAGGEEGLQRNSSYIAKLKIGLKRIRRENVISHALPPEMAMGIMETIDYIEQL